MVAAECVCFWSGETAQSQNMTPAATGTAPPPVPKVFRKWGPGHPTADSIHHWSPVFHPIFTNHHHMGKSGHTWKIRKAAESTADPRTNITHGMELLEELTVGRVDPRTGHRRGGGKHSLSGRWPTAPRGGPLRSDGRAPGARTTPWRGGSGTRRGERPPRRGGESGHPPAGGPARPAVGGGPWRDSGSRSAPQSGGEEAPPRGGPSPPTGGGRGPRREGTERTKPAPEGEKRWARNRTWAGVPDTPRSRGGDLTKNVAPTSVSETLNHIPTFTVSKVLRRRSQTWNHLVSYLMKHLTLGDPLNSNKHFMHLKSYKKKKYIYIYIWKVLCLMYNIKVFLNAYFFGNYLPNAAPKGYKFCFYMNCRIGKTCSLLGVNLFLSWLNRAVDHFL